MKYLDLQWPTTFSARYVEEADNHFGDVGMKYVDKMWYKKSKKGAKGKKEKV